MSKLPMLRALVKQRLNVAAEEICGLFEKTSADYEEELSWLKENEQRQCAVFNPKVQSCRSDIQQQLVIKEEVPPKWSLSLDQQDPELLHIKEEQVEPWTSQEGQQLNGLRQADITKFPFTAVPAKREDDEDKPRSLQLHRSQTEDKRKAEPPASSSAAEIERETDGEDCGESGAARNQHLDSHPANTESEDNENGKKGVSQRRGLTVEKPFGCDVCEKIFTWKSEDRRHVIIHTGEEPFGCDVCGKRFKWMTDLKMHILGHIAERPFGCDICGKRYNYKGALMKHIQLHTA